LVRGVRLLASGFVVGDIKGRVTSQGLRSPAGGNVRHIKRIVVGVDGSEASMSAARWALHEAHRSGATLTVVHVWQSSIALIGCSPQQASHIAGFVDAAQHVLDGVIKRLSAEAEAAHVSLDPVLIPGEPGPVLVDESTDADMLVVGSHGRGALGRAVLGSVSAYCVHHATCSTLIVPSRPLAEHRREWLSLVNGEPEVALRSAAREVQARHRRAGGHGFAVGPRSNTLA
jgi:nucleotide-binding universal stress UspA family protein